MAKEILKKRADVEAERHEICHIGASLEYGEDAGWNPPPSLVIIILVINSLEKLDIKILSFGESHKVRDCCICGVNDLEVFL